MLKIEIEKDVNVCIRRRKTCIDGEQIKQSVLCMSTLELYGVSFYEVLECFIRLGVSLGFALDFLFHSLRSATAAMSTSLKPAFSWCCIASINDKNDRVKVSRIANFKENSSSTAFREKDGLQFDITISADWMEFVERSENRTNDVGGAGAYDTLRCDLVMETTPANRWRLWGTDFHLERLRRSYESLMHHHKHGGNSNAGSTDIATQLALDKSRLVFQALLSEAVVLDDIQSTPSVTPPHDIMVQLVRLTWLWSPSHVEGDNTILVRAHACCNAIPMRIHSPVEPISVTVAAEAHDNGKVHVAVDKSLPSRYTDPQNKVASWTRLRKKMEEPKKYKPPGISEVLLVRPSMSNPTEMEVLEGLSSNFFVVYKDGTLRTAQDGVLNGYVRQLVLKSAKKFGIKVDSNPILMEDAKKGFWKEAFITSSSRLIFPVSRVMLHSDDKTKLEEYWTDPMLTERVHYVGKKLESSTWQKLLDEILRLGGYPT